MPARTTLPSEVGIASRNRPIPLCAKTPFVPKVVSSWPLSLSAMRRLTGRPPTAAVLALLLAQSAFETGHWKSLHHFNFGNAKAGPNYPLITQFRCSEVDQNGVETFYDPPHPQCNFRAYENAAAGALDYLKVLHNRPHWGAGRHT